MPTIIHIRRRDDYYMHSVRRSNSSICMLSLNRLENGYGQRWRGRRKIGQPNTSHSLFPVCWNAFKVPTLLPQAIPVFVSWFKKFKEQLRTLSQRLWDVPRELCAAVCQDMPSARRHCHKLIKVRICMLCWNRFYRLWRFLIPKSILPVTINYCK